MSSIEEVIDKTVKRRSPLISLLEDEKEVKARELERLKIERLIEEEKRRIDELRSGRQPSEQVQLPILGGDPKKVVELLKELDADGLAKLAALSAAIQGGHNLLPLFALIKSGNPDSTSSTALIELIKMLAQQQQAMLQIMIQQQAQPTSSMKDVAESMKTIVEMALNMAKERSQSGSPIDALKGAWELISPIYEKLMESERKLLEKRIEDLENRIIPPEDYIRRVREVAVELGLSPKEGGSSSEIEKMKIDLEKWKKEKDFEFQKWLEEQRLSNERTRLIIEMLNRGPLGSIVGGLGKALAGRIGGSPPSSDVEEVVCAKCSNKFIVLAGQRKVICPYCGTTLVKQVEEVEQGGGGQGGEEGGVGSNSK